MDDKKEWWVFTFGCGHTYAGYYVKIKGTYAEARRKMCKKYGIKWAFQYSLEEWQRIIAKMDALHQPHEQELEVIE
jgi:hypothetical protein